MIKIHGNDMILPSLFSAPGRVGPVQQALQHLRQELPERPRRQHRDIPECESVGRSDRGIDYLKSSQSFHPHSHPPDVQPATEVPH